MDLCVTYVRVYHLYLPIARTVLAIPRDKLVHDYFDIDVDIIWNIITHELPKLKKAIDSELRNSPFPLK